MAANSPSQPDRDSDHFGCKPSRRARASPNGCYISWYDPADSRWHQIDVHGNIITAKEESKLGAHPRAERDQAFSDDEDSARHDLAALFRTFSPH